MPFEDLFEGHGRRVRFWAARQQDVEHGFFQCPGVRPQEEKKVAHVLFQFVEQGKFPSNREKFKQVEGELFEIKAYQLRLIGFFCAGDFIVVLCVRKKQDALKKSDVEKAKANRLKCLQELQK